jgi:HPt (histidine-containing phosphotransfer) domain-containing protein
MANESLDALIDMTQINNLKSLFNEGFEPFLVSFYEDFESKEQQLDVAVKNNQMDMVGKIAHSLKGSSLNLGALGLANLCSKIEVASKTGATVDIYDAQKELKTMYPLVKAEFNRISSIH